MAVLYGDDGDDRDNPPAMTPEQVFRAVGRMRGQSEESINAAWRARNAEPRRNGQPR